MNSTNCEIIRQAAMAWADGETTALNFEQVQSHLAGCPECRRAVEELQLLNRILTAPSRRIYTVNLWPTIQDRIAAPTSKIAPPNLSILLTSLVIMLILSRAVVLATTQPLEWVIRFAALFFVIGWFLLQRENPFAINTDLIETKETRS